MAGHGDLQEMLRMLTARKVSMMAAMGYIKTLQAKSLKSIDQIANAPLSDIEAAINDAKLAKSFHAACKYHGKRGKGKRAAEESAPSAPAKKQKLEIHRRDLDYASMTPDEIETSLRLPLVEDEELIRSTVVVTNRAPLLLAFAVELLRFTMPEQPLSGRLSLAQAVVSANSKSKAISIGMEKAPAGGGSLIPEGQPKVRVMGREVPVLKRSGYAWKLESEQEQENSSNGGETPAPSAAKTWTTSQKRSSKASTFVAHAAALSSPSLRPGLMRSLMSKDPALESATHNAWAMRTSFGDSPLVQEASFDDGETGCGKFLLEVMRGANIQNTLVVLTRWYGGVLLGQDRWRLMRECVDDALSSQQRTSTPTLSGEALWGLDPDDQRPATTTTTTIGMAIHRPEGARNYLLRSFASASQSQSQSQSHGRDDTKKSSSAAAAAAAASEESQENLGRVLGAIRLLFASWADDVGREELDRKAWSWYAAVRPEVEAGVSGWGAKGTLSLAKILDLRRKAAP